MDQEYEEREMDCVGLFIPQENIITTPNIRSISFSVPDVNTRCPCLSCCAQRMFILGDEHEARQQLHSSEQGFQAICQEGTQNK